MKKKVEKKVAVKKGSGKAAERDSFGFLKGSKSSQAVLMLASKALLKDVRRKFSTLSFSKLFLDLKARGFGVQNDGGKCSIAKR